MFKAGGPWAGGFSGNVDNFHIATGALTASDATYNFDPNIVADAYGHLDPNASSGPGYEAYAHEAWALANTRLNLDLKLNSGNANNKITAAQNYLGFSNTRLQVVDADQVACSPNSSAMNADTTTFSQVLQNQVCNGPGSCIFGQISVPAGSMAYASGKQDAVVSADFRVARVGLCTTGLGNATLAWQNDAANNRDSFIEDELLNRVSTFASYTGYTVHVVAPQLVGHVTWQSIPQPDARTARPITVTVKSGASEQNFSTTTDCSGYFTVSMGTSASGTYDWRVKGPNSLANSGSFAFVSSSVFTRVEMNQVYPNGASDCAVGCIRGGDASDDNRVDISDFNILRSTFGSTTDGRADFNNDGVVNIQDFNILRTNFGVAGAPPITPGRGGAR